MKRDYLLWKCEFSRIGEETREMEEKEPSKEIGEHAANVVILGLKMSRFLRFFRFKWRATQAPGRSLRRRYLYSQNIIKIWEVIMKRKIYCYS